jgi:hypothetical protein
MSQFKTEPSVFPALATIKSRTGSNSPVAARPVRTTSEDAGKIVAARKALRNKLV